MKLGANDTDNEELSEKFGERWELVKIIYEAEKEYGAETSCPPEDGR